ncbi:MAG: hypothetical protein NZZ41_07115 [Candidatus Dojkabacteria bacterium]|nr:hypothetical protein [Candidatus Dojkabacteria bacterium]
MRGSVSGNRLAFLNNRAPDKTKENQKEILSFIYYTENFLNSHRFKNDSIKYLHKIVDLRATFGPKLNKSVINKNFCNVNRAVNKRYFSVYQIANKIIFKSKESKLEEIKNISNFSYADNTKTLFTSNCFFVFSNFSSENNQRISLESNIYLSSKTSLAIIFANLLRRLKDVTNYERNQYFFPYISSCRLSKDEAMLYMLSKTEEILKKLFIDENVFEIKSISEDAQNNENDTIINKNEKITHINVLDPMQLGLFFMKDEFYFYSKCNLNKISLEKSCSNSNCIERKAIFEFGISFYDSKVQQTILQLIPSLS